MVDEMGIFRTTIAVAPLARPEDRRELHDVMVDTGSEYNWIPRPVLEEIGIEPQRVERFETADGRVLTRDIGWAILHAPDARRPPSSCSPKWGTWCCSALSAWKGSTCV